MVVHLPVVTSKEKPSFQLFKSYKPDNIGYFLDRLIISPVQPVGFGVVLQVVD